METHVALIGILVDTMDAVPAVNALLHQYYPHIIGRMGVPYHAKNVHVISIAVDAPEDVITELTEKIGALSGVTVKTTCSTACDHRS